MKTLWFKLVWVVAFVAVPGMLLLSWLALDGRGDREALAVGSRLQGSTRLAPIWTVPVTDSHVAFAQNWVRNLKRAMPAVRYRIFCLDEDCFRRLTSGGYEVELVRNESDAGSWQWRPFRKRKVEDPCRFCMVKFTIALELLLKGEAVVICDTDLFVKADMAPVIPMTEDITVQCDCFLQQDLERRKGASYTAVLNIGFMLLLPTARSIYFLRYLLKVKQQVPEAWDQQVVSDLLLGPEDEERSLAYGQQVMVIKPSGRNRSHWSFLEKALLPSLRVAPCADLPAYGAWVDDRGVFGRARGLHTNSLENKEVKALVFRERGLWKDLDLHGQEAGFRAPYYQRKFLVLPDLVGPTKTALASHLEYGALLAKATGRVLVLPRIRCAQGAVPLLMTQVLTYEGNRHGLHEFLGGNLVPPCFLWDPLVQEHANQSSAARPLHPPPWSQVATAVGGLNGLQLTAVQEESYLLNLTAIPPTEATAKAQLTSRLGKDWLRGC